MALLKCEGRCSKQYTELDRQVSRLRAAGYTPSEVRAEISHQQRATAHTESRRVSVEATRSIFVMFVCQECGHERVYGVEEML